MAAQAGVRHVLPKYQPVERYLARHTKYRLSNTDFQCDLRLRFVSRIVPPLRNRFCVIAPKDISNVFNIEIIILLNLFIEIIILFWKLFKNKLKIGFDYREKIYQDRYKTRTIYIVRNKSSRVWQTFRSIFRGERRKIFIRCVKIFIIL